MCVSSNNLHIFSLLFVPISINKCFTTKEKSLVYKRMLKYWKEYTEEVKSFLHRKTLRWYPRHWWSPPLGPKITRYKKWFGSFSLDVELFVNPVFNVKGFLNWSNHPGSQAMLLSNSYLRVHFERLLYPFDYHHHQHPLHHPKHNHPWGLESLSPGSSSTGPPRRTSQSSWSAACWPRLARLRRQEQNEPVQLSAMYIYIIKQPSKTRKQCRRDGANFWGRC